MDNKIAARDNHILETDYEVLGYSEKLTYTELYRVLLYSLSSLHRQGLRFEAIELFNDTIGDFKPLYDKTFAQNFKEIGKEYPDTINRYRLHRAELVALLQRAGMFELPDLRYDAKPDWSVPLDLDELEQSK